MVEDFASDRRKYPRLPAEALISVTHTEATEFAWSVNLSLGGLRFV